MLLGTLGLGLAMLAPFAKADTLDVFNLNAELVNGTTVSGAVTIDVSTGMITGASLDYMGQTYGTVLFQGADTGSTAPNHTAVPFAYEFDVGTSSALYPAFVFLAQGPVAMDSLYGYTGGPLCSLNNLCGRDELGLSYSSDYYDSDGQFQFPGGYLFSGTLSFAGTLPASGVPEPSTVTLLVTALLGGVGFSLLKRA